MESLIANRGSRNIIPNRNDGSGLWHGLKRFFAFDEGAGFSSRDLICGTVAAAKSSATWNPNGLNLGSTSGSGGALLRGPALTKSWTMAFRCNPAAGGQRVFIDENGTAGAMYLYTSSNKLRVTIHAIVDNVVQSVTLADGKFHTWVVTRSGNEWAVYVDGKIEGTGSNSTTQTSTTTMGIGYEINTAGRELGATWQWFAAWNRALTPSEVRSLQTAGNYPVTRRARLAQTARGEDDF